MMSTSSNQTSSLLLFLYDDLQISSTELDDKINLLFTSIEKFNPKEDEKTKKPSFFLFFSKEEHQITLKNRYYQCKISIVTHPISKIHEIRLQEHEGIIIYLHKTSILNNTFGIVSKYINENDTFSTCMVLFDSPREDIETSEKYEEFIGDTLDKHFEIICDCSNTKTFNDEDGLGVINSSLHNSKWKSSEEVSNQVKPPSIINEINKEKNEENKNKGYIQLDDNEELEKMFTKLKEIKLINSNPNISDEERRNNAEQAILMMTKMFGIEDEDDEEEYKNK